MNLFFGKISKAFDVNQLKEGYYISPKGSSWFANIEPEDYAYIIGGDKIQFWKAKEWGEKDGKECLWFEILNDDLGISISGLAALKFLKVTSDLIVMTSRSARNRAFFQLELLEEVSVEELKRSVTYADKSIYRKINILESKQFVKDFSKDIQFFYENEEFCLYHSNFLDEKVINNFTDNLKYIGRGAPRKDKTLSLIQRTKPAPAVEFSHEEISLLNLYDALFCEYKIDEKHYLAGAYWPDDNPADQTPRFVKESIWVNGYSDKYISNVNMVPVGSKIAIKSSYTRGRTNSVMLIKARGTVVENPKDGQNLTVEWEEDFQPFEVGFGGYMGTIKEVKSKEHIDTIWNREHEMGAEEERRKAVNKEAFPLNQILYGPPGTGKTYSTIDLAAKIIGFDTGSHEENLKAFNERVGKNIEFVTFHQSFTYEDFIEGIKPQTSETKDRGKQVTYEVKDGVFKKMAKRARKANLSIKTEESQVKFERAFDELKNELAASENDEIEIPMKRVSYHITGISSDYIKFRKSSGGTGHDLKVEVLRKIFTGDIEYSKDGLGIYYHPLVDYLKEKSEDAPQTEEEKAEETHVLIIDEINRGNVAAIFGELITLIEEDKRAGGNNPISITLPYSKTEFSVPSNLYLIGTMNTADRSVEALDTALRRRFSFTEVPPDPVLLQDIRLEDPDGQSLHLEPLLRTINHRITRLIDRDHTIGHAYFMGIATATDPWQALREVFHRNLLPLLQEYFFGDHGKVGLVLGSGFVEKEKMASDFRFAEFDHPAAEDFYDRTLYRLMDVANMETEEFQQAVRNILPAKKTATDD